MPKKKTKTSSATNETAVTTPNVPSWIQGPHQTYAGQLGAYQQLGAQPGAVDGTVAPVSGLQQQAFDRAGGLGGWRSHVQSGADLLRGVKPLGAEEASAPAMGAMRGYGAERADVFGYGAAQGRSQGYQAAQGATAGYRAPNLMGFDMPQISAPTATFDRFEGARLGPAASMDAALMNRSEIRDVDGGTAAAGMAQYLNPYLSEVADGAAADIERQRQRSQADYDSRLAATRAFGSRGELARTQIDRDAMEVTGSTLGGLRSQGWQTALAAAQDDAARRLQAGMANQGMDYSVLSGNAGYENAARSFNTSALNDFEKTRAGFQQEAGINNANLSAQVSIANANNTLQAGIFNTGNLRDQYFKQADYDFQAARDGGQWENENRLDTLRRADQASQYTAEAANRYGLDYLARRDQADAFVTGARNTAALDYAGRADAAGRFGAEQDNAAARERWQGLLDLNRFNAGQRGEAAYRTQQAQLQGAGLYGDLGRTYGAQENADVAAMLQAGGVQRDVDQQRRDAFYQYLQRQGSLLGAMPGWFNGQTVNTSGSSRGRTVETGFSGSDVATMVAALRRG